MWKNSVELGRTQMTIWRMGIACCIPKATNTHTQALPLQQWVHGRASISRYTDIACLVNVLSMSCRIPGKWTLSYSFYQLRIHNHVNSFRRYMPRVEYFSSE
jgi:acyl carrier protein phosphodiesterase